MGRVLWGFRRSAPTIRSIRVPNCSKLDWWYGNNRLEYGHFLWSILGDICSRFPPNYLDRIAVEGGKAKTSRSRVRRWLRFSGILPETWRRSQKTDAPALKSQLPRGLAGWQKNKKHSGPLSKSAPGAAWEKLMWKHSEVSAVGFDGERERCLVLRLMWIGKWGLFAAACSWKIKQAKWKRMLHCGLVQAVGMLQVKRHLMDELLDKFTRANVNIFKFEENGQRYTPEKRKILY